MSKVLVVDDEPDLRLLARMILESGGHEVVEAADGTQALQALVPDSDIEVVLLDLRMPHLSGWDVLAELRRRGMLDIFRVVVFSAHLEPSDYGQTLAEGAHAYLTKPFLESDLLELVERTA